MSAPRESLEALVSRAEALTHDMTFAAVSEWKAEATGRKAIGTLPVAAPVELITAAGMLPVGLVGGGDQVEIIRGDAYFQSYICHLPRSVVELGVSGRLDSCDGFLFPSTCDVIRNLSGVWQLLFPEKYVKYVDVPQDFSREVGGRWWHSELQSLRHDLGELSGNPASDESLWRAIRLHDTQRALLRELDDLRSEQPWKVPTSELYVIRRAGLTLPVERHVEMLQSYRDLASESDRPRRDHSRVALVGAFCEQPPLGLIQTLERAGCYIVEDDLLLGQRFFGADVGRGGETDPIAALVRAFLEDRVESAFVYTDDRRKGEALAQAAKARRAEGVIFCAPSFCDPALLDRPMLAETLDEHGIAHVSLKYAENTGQFQPIREQAGTFADALKLWGAS